MNKYAIHSREGGLTHYFLRYNAAKWKNVQSNASTSLRVPRDASPELASIGSQKSDKQAAKYVLRKDDSHMKIPIP